MARPELLRKAQPFFRFTCRKPIVPAAIEGFYSGVATKPQLIRGFTPLKMVFGNPIFPPPESQASEEAYEKLTSVLKARIEKMWEELRQAGDAPDSGAGAGGPPAKGINAAVPA